MTGSNWAAVGTRRHRTLRDLIWVAAVAVVYFVAAKFGLSLAFSTKQVTALWPPTGIAVAALLLGGYRVWPGIYLAAFAVNALVGDSILVAAGIAMGNTLGPVVARFFLRRLGGFAPSLARVRDVLALLVFGAVLGAAVSATSGVATLAFGAVIPWSAYAAVWRVWWVGDGMGILVFTPLILGWATRSDARLSPVRIAEIGALFTGLLLAGLVALVGVLDQSSTPFQLQYAVFPFIIWSGLRFGLRETTAAVTLVTALAVWGAVHDRGPFAEGNLDQRLILLEMFMAVSTVTGLILSAVTAERSQAQQALRRANDQLGGRVEARTAELSGRLTQLATAQERLRESEARFRGAFESAAVGMALVAPDGRWLQVNRFLCRMVGYAADELLATDFQSITHPDDLEMDVGYVGRVLDGSLSNYDLEKRYIHKEGRILWVLLSVSLVRDAAARPLYLVGLIQDITEQRRLKVDLLQARADLQAILDNVPARITAWHADWTNQFINRAAAAEFGVDAAAAVGAHAAQILGPERHAQAQRYIASALAGERQSYEQVDTDCDGAPRYSHVEFIPQWRDATVVGFYALATDITKLRESYRRVRELAQRLETVREDERRAIARTLHEGIAQELFAMALGLQHLRNQTAGHAGVIEMCEELKQAIDACMLDARQIANELRPSALANLPVTAALREHARYFADISGLTIRVFEQAPIPVLEEAVALVLFRAAQESLTNVARHAQAATVDIALAADVGSVRMDITDDGIGIADGALAKSGSLGLLGIRERVNARGGSFTVARNGGGGTTLSVCIPRSAMPAASLS